MDTSKFFLDLDQKYSFKQIRGKSHDTALVIPVLNEGDRLLTQLDEIKSLKIPVDVFIADGGSDDGSIEKIDIQELGVNFVIKSCWTKNLSKQLICAFHLSEKLNYTSVITMDGNGKDEVLDLNKFIRKLNEGFDFIQGSRFKPGGIEINTPISRKLAIKYIHVPLTNWKSSFKYSDTTNGFRGFSMEIIRDPKVGIFRDVFNGYDLLAYLPVRASKLRFKICEVPVKRSYPENGPVPTKIKGFKVKIKIIYVLIKVSLGKYNPS